MTNPKELLIQLLQGNIQVYEDDGATLILGIVAGSWFDKELFKDYDFQVSIGPDLGTESAILDLGAQNREYVETVAVNVWILQKRGVNYTPERLRHDVIHQIDELLFPYVNDPASDIDHMAVTDWCDMDEPKENILRSEMTVDFYYQKALSDVYTPPLSDDFGYQLTEELYQTAVLPGGSGVDTSPYNSPYLGNNAIFGYFYEHGSYLHMVQYKTPYNNQLFPLCELPVIDEIYSCIAGYGTWAMRYIKNTPLLYCEWERDDAYNHFLSKKWTFAPHGYKSIITIWKIKSLESSPTQFYFGVVTKAQIGGDYDDHMGDWLTDVKGIRFKRSAASGNFDAVTLMGAGTDPTHRQVGLGNAIEDNFGTWPGASGRLSTVTSDIDTIAGTEVEGGLMWDLGVLQPNQEVTIVTYHSFGDTEAEAKTELSTVKALDVETLLADEVIWWRSWLDGGKPYYAENRQLKEWASLMLQTLKMHWVEDNDAWIAQIGRYMQASWMYDFSMYAACLAKFGLGGDCKDTFTWFWNQWQANGPDEYYQIYGSYVPSNYSYCCHIPMMLWAMELVYTDTEDDSWLSSMEAFIDAIIAEMNLTFYDAANGYYKEHETLKSEMFEVKPFESDGPFSPPLMYESRGRPMFGTQLVAIRGYHAAYVLYTALGETSKASACKAKADAIYANLENFWNANKTYYQVGLEQAGDDAQTIAALRAFNSFSAHNYFLFDLHKIYPMTSTRRQRLQSCIDFIEGYQNASTGIIPQIILEDGSAIDDGVHCRAYSETHGPYFLSEQELGDAEKYHEITRKLFALYPKNGCVFEGYDPDGTHAGYGLFPMGCAYILLGLLALGVRPHV